MMDKILIIDNDDDVRNNLYEILTTLDFEVITAKNPSQGIICALKEQPDLIICDIVMDKLNGYDVLSELQHNKKTASIPFIFLSCKSTILDIRQGMEFGADDYIIKPFEIKSLIKTINTRINRRKQYQEIAEKKLTDLRHSISSSLPHEINTPLAGIASSAQILKDLKDRLTAEQLEELGDIILESTNRLSTLLNNFLLFSELELLLHNSEKLEQIRQENQCILLSEKVISIARQIAQQNNRENDLSLKLQHYIVSISEHRLEKVLIEIIGNAFKYSHPEQQVSIAMENRANEVKLFVTNEGNSMTEMQIQNIGAYTQFDRDIHEQQGLGLGLIIAKKIMEIYEGKLEIKSIPYRETTIILSFKKA